MVKESVSKALGDANIKYDSIKQAVVGYVYGMFPHQFFISLKYNKTN